MAECCCSGLGFDHCVADTAVASFCLSGCFTGGRYGCIFYRFVACRCDCFCSGLLAAAAGVSLRSGCGAGCCLGYFSAVPAMAECCCSSLGFDHCVADTAVASFCLSGCLTGGCYRRVFYCLVACGCDRFCACFLAAGTGVGLRSGCGAGCCFCYLSAVPVVAKRYCCGLGFEYGSADAAVTSFGFSSCLTGGCYCCILYCLVTCGCDRFCSCLFAAGTGVGLRSSCGTGCCLCYLSTVPAVA